MTVRKNEMMYLSCSASFLVPTRVQITIGITLIPILCYVLNTYVPEIVLSDLCTLTHSVLTAPRGVGIIISLVRMKKWRYADGLTAIKWWIQ